MAPELLEGRPASPVTDTYSVGVLLFYLLSGYLPVVGASLPTCGRRTARASAPACAICDRSCPTPSCRSSSAQRMPDPAARYATAGELEHALAGMLGDPRRRSRSRAVDRDRRAAGAGAIGRMFWPLMCPGGRRGAPGACCFDHLSRATIRACPGDDRCAVQQREPGRDCRRTAGWSYTARSSTGGRCCGFGRSIPIRAGRWPAPPRSRVLSGRRIPGCSLLRRRPSEDNRHRQRRIETLTDVGRPRGGDWNK